MKSMNTVRTTILTAILCAATSAIADTVPATRTFEALVTTVRMPTSTSGTIALRECNDCEYESIRVTPGTRYSLNGENMRLDEFRNLVQEWKSRGERTINVMRDEASNTVVTVFVYTQ